MVQFVCLQTNIVDAWEVTKCVHQWLQDATGVASWLILLTGSSTVTTPRSFTTLGCLNCPLMAASCRNFTASLSEAPGFSVFTATSMVPVDNCHTPLVTVPNWPDPRWSVILQRLLQLSYSHPDSQCIKATSGLGQLLYSTKISITE